MSRFLAFLKYLPAVVCGLLVIAWATSFFAQLGIRFPLGNGRGTLYLETGRLSVGYRSPPTDWGIQFVGDDKDWYFRAEQPGRGRHWSAIFGDLNWEVESAASVSNAKWYRLVLPIPLVLLFAIPLALAPFMRFRFPLWSYFLWTACVAAALGFYLR